MKTSIGRLLIVVSSLLLAATTTAEARHYRYHHYHHHYHHVVSHHYRYHHYAHYRHYKHYAHYHRGVRYEQDNDQSPVQVVAAAGGGAISRAMSFVGRTAGQLGLPRRDWCADFLNMIFHHPRGADRRAISYAHVGSPAPRGCVGCVAVMPHHVGIVTGWRGGRPVIVSGNHGHRVGVGTYSPRRIVAYRMVSN